MEKHGYKVINECLKVWYVIAVIKYGAFKYINTTILADSPYCQDFDASVILYKYYITQSKDMNVELNILGVGTKDSDSSGKGNLTGDIKDKYYRIELYTNSSKRQREEHADLHKKHKKKAGNSGCRGSGETSPLSSTRSIILHLYMKK